MLASFITFFQTTMSFLIWSANCAEVLPTGWKLNLSSVALKSGRGRFWLKPSRAAQYFQGVKR
jgi:hypothetical protein